MTITVLVDNLPHPEKELLAEHGLSLYFEADNHKWLFDTGRSGIFLENAQKLGIKIEAVDYLILSHAHNDHTGGLAKFVQVNQKAKIFLSAAIGKSNFYSFRRNVRKDISPDHTLLTALGDRLIEVDQDMSITENVAIVSHIPKIYPVPKANDKLIRSIDGVEQADDYRHEMVLVVRQSGGMVVFSGCSHMGILNILQACSHYFENIPITACIGGTHLIDSDGECSYENVQEIEHIGRSILHNYPQMRLITGHCTGSLAKEVLAKGLEKKFITFYTGFSAVV